MRSLILAAALSLSACGGLSYSPLLDDVGASCSSSTCRAALACYQQPMFVDAPTCLLPRENGEHCPEGGTSLAWGAVTQLVDGGTSETATFACSRFCASDGDCPPTSACLDSTAEHLGYCLAAPRRRVHEPE